MDRPPRKFKATGNAALVMGLRGVETQPDGGNEIVEFERSVPDRAGGQGEIGVRRTTGRPPWGQPWGIASSIAAAAP